MAKVLGVTRDSYYKWLSRKEGKRVQENEFLIKKIKEIFYLHKKRYGSSRIYYELLKEDIICSRQRVGRLMKVNGLKSIRLKRFKITTNPRKNKKASPNLLNQNFEVDAPNKVWVSDITYIQTKEGWLYLTTIIDLFNREIIGHSRSYTLKTKDTILKAFNDALRKRIPQKGLIFHSEEGFSIYRCIIQENSKKL